MRHLNNATIADRPITTMPAHTASAWSGTTTGTYSCPMHPEVTGKRGDKCPKCGMALEERVGC